MIFLLCSLQKSLHCHNNLRGGHQSAHQEYQEDAKGVGVCSAHCTNTVNHSPNVCTGAPDRVDEAPVLGEGEALRRHVALGALAGGAQHVPAARRHQLRAPQVDHLQLAAHKHEVWRLNVHVDYVSK